MTLHRLLSIKGKVIFVDNKAEIPNKPELTKKVGLLIDHSRTIPITLWNEQIQKVSEGFYQIENIRLRQFKRQNYLSGEKEVTVFKKLSKDYPKISEDKVKKAHETVVAKEVD